VLNRRLFLLSAALPAALLRAQEAARSRVRGRLTASATLQQPAGPPIQLEGDDATLKVLHDPRLHGTDVEALGDFLAPARFRIAPIHERAVFVWRSGRKLVVTYWCAVCSIRAWVPGPCQCCQEDMALDLRDPALKDTDPSD
jgi:hypothetical protein